jgi:hypothetical protein
MFDKDKVFAPDGKLAAWIDPGERFILWDCWIETEEFRPPDSDKDIAMTHLKVSSLTMPDKQEIVSSLSGPIAEKVREKKDGDLPAIVKWFTVPSNKAGFSDAVVMQFVEPYDVPAKAKK